MFLAACLIGLNVRVDQAISVAISKSVLNFVRHLLVIFQGWPVLKSTLPPEALIAPTYRLAGLTGARHLLPSQWFFEVR